MRHRLLNPASRVLSALQAALLGALLGLAAYAVADAALPDWYYTANLETILPVAAFAYIWSKRRSDAEHIGLCCAFSAGFLLGTQMGYDLWHVVPELEPGMLPKPDFGPLVLLPVVLGYSLIVGGLAILGGKRGSRLYDLTRNLLPGVALGAGAQRLVLGRTAAGAAASLVGLALYLWVNGRRSIDAGNAACAAATAAVACLPGLVL